MSRRLAILLVFVLAALAGAQSRLLRAGDLLRLTSDENPTLCIVRQLDFKGEIQLPGVGSVNLVGLTIPDAIQTIARAERMSAVDLSLSIVASRYRPVTIYGAVRHVGEFNLLPNMRLVDALRLADPTIAADLDLIEIESETGELQSVAFEANPLHPESNPYLKAGDRVIVPLATQSLQVSILGGVKTPGPVPYQRGMTVKAAVDAVGGVTNHGNAKDVRILRQGAEVQRLDLTRSPDVALKRGDTVVVALSDVRRFVTVVGEVKNGGLIAWKEGMTLAEAIRDAGGGTDKADLEALRVQRMLGEDRFRKRMSLSQDKDVTLMANDVIQVPLKGSTPAPPKPEPGPRRVVPPR